MWIAEFKAWHENSPAIENSKGVDAVMHTYMLNTFQKGKQTYGMKVAVFSGPEKEKLKALFDKDPRTKVIKWDGDQLFYYFKAHEKFHYLLLDKSVFFAKPILVKDGVEYWTIASWRKEDLNSLYARFTELKPRVCVEIICIREGPLNFFLPSVLSRLTDLQRTALSLAVKGGYYKYPRKSSLDSLAKTHGIPRTTLQSHLRKAERQILEAVAEENFD